MDLEGQVRRTGVGPPRHPDPGLDSEGSQRVVFMAWLREHLYDSSSLGHFLAV